MVSKIFTGDSDVEFGKRFYVSIEEEPPTWTCPICDKEDIVSIFEGSMYLSYPTAGCVEPVWGYCNHEDTEFEEDEIFEDVIGQITLNITYTWEPE